MTLVLATLVAGCTGGGGAPPGPPTALLPAPERLQMTAVTLSPNAYRWLASPSGQSWVNQATPAAALTPLGVVIRPLLAGPAVPSERYVVLQWRWPNPAATPVDRFLWRRAGGVSQQVPFGEGTSEPGTGALLFVATDQALDLVPGDEGTPVSYEVFAHQGNLVGPAAGVSGKLLPTLADPTLLVPDDQASLAAAQLPVLSWQGDSRAIGYQVDVVEAGTGVRVGTWFTTGASLDLAQVTPAAGGWQRGMTYEWRVLAVRTIPMFEPSARRYDSVSLAISGTRRFTLL